MFVQVFRRHRLRCNPNLCEEGVKGRLDPHGLVLVLVCGTLHNQTTVCGVFEQVSMCELGCVAAPCPGVWSDQRPGLRQQLEDKVHRGETAGWTCELFPRIYEATCWRMTLFV